MLVPATKIHENRMTLGLLVLVVATKMLVVTRKVR